MYTADCVPESRQPCEGFGGAISEMHKQHKLCLLVDDRIFGLKCDEAHAGRNLLYPNLRDRTVRGRLNE
jgi:hypothetical protein